MHRVLGDRRAIAILLGPALLVYSLIMLVPMVWSLGYSFTKGNTIDGFTGNGVANFSRLLDDPAVHDALWFSLKYAVVVTVGQVIAGYLLALVYVFFLKRASALIRTLVFFPVVLPTVAVGLLFQKFFQVAPQTGPVHSSSTPSASTRSTSSAAPAAPSGSWSPWTSGAPWASTPSCSSPAWSTSPTRSWNRPDWTGPQASGWSATSCCRSPPRLMSSLIFSINGTLKVFDSIVALTNGGPGSDTTPLTLYMFQTSFTYSDYGYGSTIALLLTVVCLLVSLVVYRVSRRDLTEG
ncbi:Melibiose/raffinose/stachyose import permease protein MelD [Streptomyces alboniger]